MRTYGELQFEETERRFLLNEVEAHVCIKLKSMFQQIKTWQTAPFKFEARPDIAVDLNWFMQRYPMNVNKTAKQKLDELVASFHERQRELEKILMPTHKPSKYELVGELRGYQGQGVDLWLKTKKILIGDDVGLGKTLIAIGAMTKPETLPMAIVVQTHLPSQWREQILKFIPFNIRVHIVKKRKAYSLPPADIYIFRYSNISGWVDVFTSGFFKAVVYDEIQELRHQGTDKYKSARVLSDNAEYCLGLSATPIYNKGPEIFNVINMIAKDALGRWDDFMREWTNGDVVKNPKALGAYLRERHLFLRRTRDEVGRELPPVNKIVHTVGYDEEKVNSVLDIAKKLAMSIQTAEFTERGQAARELDMMMRYITGISKAKFVAEYVKILLENGEKVLLAGWHRDVYEIWAKELAEYKPVMFTGAESPNQKQRSKEDFVSGDSQIMFISLRSGVGLDGLQHCCSTVVFGELDWSPGVHEQVIGRVFRDGQKHQVTAIYLVSDSGSDPLVVELLGLKASQAKGINDPFASMEQINSDDSRMKILAERILKHGMKGNGDE